MAHQMEQSSGGGVFLDISHLPADTVKGRFPTIYKFCLGYGLDITKEPVPVAPAAHYMMGGVKIDTWGRTSIRGLYAAGEVACSGVHGANRLASNSLLDTLVFAQRLMASTLGHAPVPTTPEEQHDVKATLRPTALVCSTMPSLSLAALQDLMWRNVGISRHASRLLLTARILYAWQRTLPKPIDRDTYELRNMVVVARLMVEAALLRQESRGSHFREDFPHPLPNWEKHVVMAKEEDIQ